MRLLQEQVKTDIRSRVTEPSFAKRGELARIIIGDLVEILLAFGPMRRVLVQRGLAKTARTKN